MNEQNIIDELNRISKQYPEDKYRTIWEIFCHQNDVDYDTDTLESATFDSWVKYKKGLIK